MDQYLVVALSNVVAGRADIASAVILMAEFGIFLLPAIIGIQWFRPGVGQVERRRVVFACVLAVILAVMLSEVIVSFVYRSRPFVALGLAPLFAHVADSSFPSDHTLFGVSFIGPLVWRWPRWGGWVVAWVLLIGFARVAAGIHYPTDILGSALVAIVPTAVALILADAMLERLPRRIARYARLATDQPATPGS